MRILVDTNVLMDCVISRKPYDKSSKKVVYLCRNNKIHGCIAAHTVLNMIYILRKDLTLDERKELLNEIWKVFDVVGIDKKKIMAALNNESFSDFEDCVQSECAKEYAADYIITRNVDDFKTSAVRAITPDEFLAIVKK